nr:hypothetical protein [uncultured Sphaerochaeta sp.]
MKKLVLVLLTLSFCLTVGFASPSDMFLLADPIHHQLSTLYVSQGLALPSTALPYTRAEVTFLLSRINIKDLSLVENQIYELLAKEATMEMPAFSIGSEISLETYLHSNTNDFTSEEDWVYSYLERRPLIHVPMTLSLGVFSGVFDLTIVSNNIDGKVAGTMDQGTSKLYGEKYLTTNIPYDFSSGTAYLDANIPYRAFLASGGANWAIQVGRDRLSWGPGVSGNFVIGDQLQYHNMARISAYKDSFKYSFLVSFFPHPNEIYDSSLSDSQARPLTGLKMFMGHRFEWRLFSDRVGLVLNEGIMYQNQDGLLDLRVLTPMMLYHNYYLRSQANSLASLELDYTFQKGLNIYTQFAVDELAFGGTEWNLESGRHPNGLAIMLGGRMEKPLRNGVLRGHLEGVYTDPYLYLRSLDGDKTQDDQLDSLNYVVGLRKWYSDHIVYDQTYLGYQYGGDAIVLSTSLGYYIPNSWYVRGRFFSMLHGDNDETSLWTLDDIASAPSGNTSTYVQLGVTAGTALGPWEVYGSFDFLSTANNADYNYDFQLVFGACYTWE